MKKIELLAIGDMTIDAFIRIEQARLSYNKNSETNEICLPFGDKVPYKSVTVVPAVGNSANAAVSAARLGLKAGLISNIGNDKEGEDCLDALEEEDIHTDLISKEKGKNTNYHFVLWYNDDRTILIKHSDFNYTLPKKLAKISPSYIYLSSLADNTLLYHKEIAKYLEEHPETKLAFQPGTFQMKLGTDALMDIYRRTEIFFCNFEEAERILKVESKDILELSKGIKSLGPSIVVISDGPKGAYMYVNEELWQLPIYPDIAPPFERTGAGDAFSSTITSALVLGKSPLEAFAWGPINSMCVVQEIGAQKGLLSREKLEGYLKKAPEYYKPKKIN